jgi:hypothetical protein
MFCQQVIVAVYEERWVIDAIMRLYVVLVQVMLPQVGIVLLDVSVQVITRVQREIVIFKFLPLGLGAQG